MARASVRIRVRRSMYIRHSPWITIDFPTGLSSAAICACSLRRAARLRGQLTGHAASSICKGGPRSTAAGGEAPSMTSRRARVRSEARRSRCRRLRQVVGRIGQRGRGTSGASRDRRTLHTRAPSPPIRLRWRPTQRERPLAACAATDWPLPQAASEIESGASHPPCEECQRRGVFAKNVGITKDGKHRPREMPRLSMWLENQLQQPPRPKK